MKKGGKRPGAGRPKGSTTRPQVIDYYTPEELKAFFEDLKKRAKDDTKIALYLAEQMTGKASQAITGPEGGPIQIEGVTISIRK